jgi:hypothetical protein
MSTIYNILFSKQVKVHPYTENVEAPVNRNVLLNTGYTAKNTNTRLLTIEETQIEYCESLYSKCKEPGAYEEYKRSLSLK